MGVFSVSGDYTHTASEILTLVQMPYKTIPSNQTKDFSRTNKILCPLVQGFLLKETTDQIQLFTPLRLSTSTHTHTHTVYSLFADAQHMGNWNLLMIGSWFRQAFIYYFCICLFITVPWNISLGCCFFVWRDHSLSRCDNVCPAMFSGSSLWGLHASKINKGNLN